MKKQNTQHMGILILVEYIEFIQLYNNIVLKMPVNSSYRAEKSGDEIYNKGRESEQGMRKDIQKKTRVHYIVDDTFIYN